jgi:hypothetical protein
MERITLLLLGGIALPSHAFFFSVRVQLMCVPSGFIIEGSEEEFVE